MTLSGILGQYKKKYFTDSESKLHSQIGDTQLLILKRYSLTHENSSLRGV